MAEWRIANGNRKLLIRLLILLSALWSLECTVYAGAHNPSLLLRVLFVIWVVSPFGGADRLVKAYGGRQPNAGFNPAPAGAIACVAAAALLTEGTIGVVLRQRAAPFLLVPAGLWAILALLALAARASTNGTNGAENQREQG